LLSRIGLPDHAIVDRRLSGEEALALQGFSLKELLAQKEFMQTLTHAQKLCLAGNAFCAAVLPPVLSLLTLAQLAYQSNDAGVGIAEPDAVVIDELSSDNDDAAVLIEGEDGESEEHEEDEFDILA
jgi:hypothetical protein